MRNWIAGLLLSLGVAFMTFGVTVSIQEVRAQRDIQRQLIELETATEQIKSLTANYQEVFTGLQATRAQLIELQVAFESIGLTELSTAVDEELIQIDRRIRALVDATQNAFAMIDVSVRSLFLGWYSGEIERLERIESR